jgi:DNA (cytosine-5)-methyltransferase 1
MNLTHSDYFAGVGGFSIGAHRAGIETIHFTEIEDHLSQFLQTKFPKATYEKDITTSEGRPADIFTAGFPCQDISTANPKGKGLDGARSGLVYTFLNHVGLFRPKYFILENSPNIFGKGFGELLTVISKIGYDAEWTIISKKAFGYPDARKRFILIAYDNQIRRKTNLSVFDKSAVKYSYSAATVRQDIWPNITGTADTYWQNVVNELCPAYDGISKRLDLSTQEVQAMAAYGNAFCPDIAHFLFELIKIHHDNTIYKS